MLKYKDIIFYVTEGSVSITQPDNVTQKEGHKPDTALIATTFLGSPIAERVAIWIIALSVILGVILLILLVLGLVKMGFFNRKKKLELEALIAETDVCLVFSSNFINENSHFNSSRLLLAILLNNNSRFRKGII